MNRTPSLKDICLINPLTKLKKGSDVKFISMDKLDPFTKVPSGFETRKFSSGSKFKNGDTLLARITPCLENGKTGYVDILADGEIAAGSTEFIVLRAIEGRTIPEYIYYLSISSTFREYAIRSMVGTSGRQRVQIDVLANMEINLPSLEKQKKIAEILGSLDEKIELNRRMNETLEQIGQTLFRKYFIDNPEVSSWPEGEIGSLGEVVTGKTPCKQNTKFFGDAVPFLKVPDMHNKAIIINTKDGLSVNGADSQKGKYIPKWSTCVSCIATVGIVSLTGCELQTNQQINSVIPKSKEYRYFIYYFMKMKSDYIKTLASSGSATPNLNKGQFEKIPATIPPLVVCELFNSSVDGIFSKMEYNYRETERLIKLRDVLLPKLISGGIKV